MEKMDKSRMHYIIVILLVQLTLNLLTIIWKEMGLLDTRFKSYINIMLFAKVVFSAFSVFLVSNLDKIIEKQTKDKIKHVKLEEKEKLIEELRRQKHDFSNHLQTIYGMLQLNKLDEACEYINSLNQELKNINKQDKVKEKTILSSILLPMKQRAEEKGVQFDFEVKLGIREVNYPLNKVFRIISNLVENAIEATEKYDGQKIIEVKGENKPGIYIISIYNSGPVINEEIKEKMFQQGVSTKGEGRGLGLSIIKSLVEENGGELELKSEADYGNQFTCYLPK